MRYLNPGVRFLERKDINMASAKEKILLMGKHQKKTSF